VELWQWLVLALGVLLLLVVVFGGIQARRRRGGIIAQRSRKLGSGRHGSKS
jgi:hypothetical protein